MPHGAAVRARPSGRTGVGSHLLWLRPCVHRSQGGGLACRPKTAGPPDAVAPGGAARSSSSSTRSSSERSCPAPEPPCPTSSALPSITTQNADWNDPITASGQITQPGSSRGHDPVQRGHLRLAHLDDRPPGRAAGRGDDPRRTGSRTIRPVHHHRDSSRATPLPGVSANGVVHINLKVDSRACRPREQREE